MISTYQTQHSQSSIKKSIMTNTCDKHGPYSTFCRDCDLDILELEEQLKNIRDFSKEIHELDHYDFIEKYGEVFAEGLNIPAIRDINDDAQAYGDKCYGYEERWNDAGIPFPIGAMIYLVGRHYPFSQTVRETSAGWVDPGDWVVHTWKDALQTRNGGIYNAIMAVYVKYRQDTKTA